MYSPNTPYPDSTITNAEQQRIDAARSGIEDIHLMYGDVLAALVTSCKEHGKILTSGNLASIMERVSEELHDEASPYIEALAQCDISDLPTSVPEKSEQMIAKASEEIYNHFRPKKIDYSEVLYQALKPRGL